MKDITKRLLSLGMAAVMCLSLPACGKKEEGAENKTLAQELGYGYLSEYKDLETELNWINSNNVSTAQGKLYFSGDYYDEDNGTNESKLYCVDPETGDTTEIPMPALENSDTVSEYAQGVSVCPDGSGYWRLVSRYHMDASFSSGEDMELYEEGAASSDDLDVFEGSTAEEGIMPLDDAEMPAEEAPAEEPPEEELPAETEDTTEDSMLEPISDEDVSMDVPQEENFAQKCDMEGNVVTEIDLTKITQDEEYFYPQYVAQNGSGDLLIASDSAIYRFGADGSQKEPIDLNDQWINSMAATEDGTVVASYYDQETSKMVFCRVEDQGLSDPLEITGFNADMGGTFYPGSGSTLLVSDGTLLYSLDVSTGKAEKMLSWLDSDINGSNLACVIASGEDKVLVMMQEYHQEGSPTYELGIMTKTPAEELPQRTILTLGAEYLGDLQKAVIDFNRKSDTYRIVFVNYGQYNTTDDYTAGSKQMDRDVISGNCPDIVSLSAGHTEKYIAKGVLADLSQMIEKDESISMEDMVAGPLKAYTVDGKLYGLPMYFDLQTMLASAELVGDRDSWTLADLKQVVDGLDEEVNIMEEHYTQPDFLTMMVRENMSQFVDYGKATCSFDSEEFKQLLELAAKLPEAKEEDQMVSEAVVDETWEDPATQVQAGKQLLMDQYVSGDSYNLKQFMNVYTEENGFKRIGYPQSEGNGALLTVGVGLGISAKSKYQEGAWEFVKTILSDELQEDIWNMPVSVSAFDKMLEKAMEKSYYMEDGEKVYYEDTAYIGETEFEMQPLTQEQADALKEYVNGASIAGGYDDDINKIIEEESGAYFAGDKTADEVAKLIQNRVATYLGETS